jgi:hypothetical protein
MIGEVSNLLKIKKKRQYMRSKIFQEILDKTPKGVKIFVRFYANLVIRINQLLRQNKNKV